MCGRCRCCAMTTTRTVPVSMRWSVSAPADTLRAYTISLDAGRERIHYATIRRIDDGAGSQWLTRDVKRGDYIWLF